MTTMIRRQVYLEPDRHAQIEQLAKERGTTEAAIMREAVDLLLAGSFRLQRAQGAWEAARALMEMRAAYAVEGSQAGDRPWTRDALYDARIERHRRNPD